MFGRAKTAAKEGGDARDLRRPETLLGVDALESLLKRLPAGAAILDVGGGALRLVDLARRGFAVHFEEVPLPTEARIPDDHRIELSVEESSHDAVLVPGLFFFLPKAAAERLVAELGRVLRKGGLGFAAFPPLWSPSLSDELLLDSATADGPDSDIVRRGGVAVRYTHWTSRELEGLFEKLASRQLVTQKNGVRRMSFRKP
jgi:hypothetical protein